MVQWASAVGGLDDGVAETRAPLGLGSSPVVSELSARDEKRRLREGTLLSELGVSAEVGLRRC